MYWKYGQQGNSLDPSWVSNEKPRRISPVMVSNMRRELVSSAQRFSGNEYVTRNL